MNSNRVSALALMLFSIFMISFAVNANAAPTINVCTATGDTANIACGYINVTNTTLDVGQSAIITINGISGGQPGVNGYTANWILNGYPDTPAIYNGIFAGAIAFKLVPNTTTAGNVYVYNGLATPANMLNSGTYSGGTNIYTVNAAITDSPSANSIVTNDIPLLTVNPQLTGTPTAALQATKYDEGQVFQLTCAAGSVTGGTLYGGTYFFQSLVYNAVSNSLVDGNLNSRAGASQGYCSKISPQLSVAGMNPGTYYAVDQLADSATTPEIADSAQTGNFVVYANPTVTEFAENSVGPTYDVGQTVTYNVMVTNGVGPFTVNLVTGGVTVNTITGISADTPAQISYKIGSTSDTTYNVVVADAGSANTGSSNTYMFNSLSSTINVDPAPTVTLTPSNALIDTGQLETYTMNVAGGVGPFNVMLYNVTGSSQFKSNVIISSPGGSNTITFVANSPTQSNAIVFNAMVTDTGTSTAYVFNSITNTILVSMDPVFNSAPIPTNSVIDIGQITSINGNTNNALTGTPLQGMIGWYLQRAGDLSYTFNAGCAAVSTLYPTAACWSGLQPATAGTYNFIISQEDSATTPYIFNSPVLGLIVNPTPTTPTLLLSNTIFDSGLCSSSNPQCITFKTALTGGTSPYTYNYVVYDAVTGNPVTTNVISSWASNTQTNSFNAAAFAAGTYYGKAFVTDSASTNEVVNSIQTSNFIVKAAPTVTFTPSSTVLDAGQTETYNIVISSGGVGPFTAALINVTSAAKIGSNAIIAAPGGSNTISFTASTATQANTVSFNTIVTDIGTNTPYLFTATANSVVINKDPTITLAATSGTSITLGGTVTFVANVPSGGAGPFTVTLHGATCLSGITTNIITSPGGNVILSCDPQSTGFYTMNASAVDTGTTTHYSLANSGAVTVSVSSSGGGGGGGSGGGGGGGGGGGTQKPVVVNITNGFNVTGIAQLNTFNVTLCGGKFFFTDNFISPNDTGISVNGKNYTIYENKPIVLFSTPTQACYMSLLNVSYLPVLHTVSIKVYIKSNGVIRTINITEQNFVGRLNGTFALSGNASDKLDFAPANVTILISTGINKTMTPNYTIENVTANTPGLANATKLAAIKLNVSNSTVILFFTMHFPCGIATSRINAYKLINGSWSSITGTTNASACAESFTLTGGDPTVGLFESALLATTTTTSAPTTASTTSISTTPLPQPQDNTGIIVAIVVLVVVVIVALLYYRSVAGKRRTAGKR